MNKSILILERNSVVQGLVASALDMEGLTLHHEFNPARYLERARTIRPDLILLGNADPSNNYSICRQLKTTAGLAQVPLVLMTGSKETLDAAQMQQLKVAGLVRKPFEASDLQQQVSRHLNLVDLIGSAYEYAKSQSAKEEPPNPLAQLDVLEPDVVGLVQDSVAGQGAGAVPEVDFSQELQQEEERDSWQAPIHAGGSMTPEPAPMAEPFKSAPGLDDDQGPVESFAIGTVESSGEPLPPELAEAADLPELGPEDLLEEESFEESRFAPESFDQPLDSGSPAPRISSSLDQIEVELSEDDLSLRDDAPPLPRMSRDVLSDDLDNVTVGSAPSERTDLPAAVRRMMEHQSVFQKAPGAVPTPTPPPAPRGDIPPAVRRMMEEKSIFERPAGAAGRTAPLDRDLEHEGLVEPGPDDEAFSEAVRRSVEESAPPPGMGMRSLDDDDALLASLPPVTDDLMPLDASDPELLGLTSSEELVLQTLDDQPELQQALAGPEEDEQEISIDEDEEELILSSLEPGALDDLESAPGESGSLYPLEEEVSLETDALGGAPGAPELDSRRLAERLVQSEQEDAGDLLMEEQDENELQQLDGAADLDLATGLPPLEDPLLGAANGEMEFDFDTSPLGDDPVVGLEALPPDISFDMDDSSLAGAAPDLDPLSDLIPPLENGLGPLEDAVPPLGDELRPMEDELSLDGEASPLGDIFGATDTGLPPLTDELDAQDMDAGGLDLSSMEGEPEVGTGLEDMEDDFESALAQLKGEIAANPEGERLDDLLRMEQLQGKIAKLDFPVPQNEIVMARAMGFYALPEQIGGKPAPAKVPATSAAPSAAALAAKMAGLPSAAALDSLMDEDTKARLSQVLDEIISISVRRAVREEMPRLVERLVRE